MIAAVITLPVLAAAYTLAAVVWSRLGRRDGGN